MIRHLVRTDHEKVVKKIFQSKVRKEGEWEDLD